MNLINRMILPLSASLLFSMALTPVACGQVGESGVEESCSCTCADFLGEKDVQACQSQCNTGWEERECAVSAMPETGDKDAETVRFEAELQNLSQQSRYQTQESVIASQVYIFQISEPGQRQALWEDLENGKQQLVEQQETEANDAESLQSMPTEDLDAETLRYKAAIEQLNLPPDAIQDLVEMFQANDAAFRKTLWQRVEESPLKK